MEEYFFNNFYSLISGIGIVVHLIINWDWLFTRKVISQTPRDRAFKRFLYYVLLFFAADTLWGLCALQKWSSLLYADTVLYFVMITISTCAWTLYAMIYTGIEGRRKKTNQFIAYALTAFLSIALIVNFFTGSFFTITEDAKYCEGPVRNLWFVLLLVFNLCGTVQLLFRLPATRGITRRHTIVVTAFVLTMMLAIIFQFYYPLLPMYAIGCLLGCCMIHVHVFEDEREEIHKNEMLAHDYEIQLETEKKMNAAKTLFFSSVSHDIRTPLNAIVGFSELLEKGVADPKTRAQYISTIRSSGKVLARLVNDVLDLSKLENGKLDIIKEPTDIPALAREVIAACEVVRAKKSIIIKPEIGDVPLVNVDPQRIRQILFNLLSNAYKYTDRGTVTVSVRWDAPKLTLSVEDTGKGISEENIRRVLQPFVQLTDRNHRDGTGLGLPICKKLVSLMGGTLNVKSTVGKGSIFTITLNNVETVDDVETAKLANGEDYMIDSDRKMQHRPSHVLIVDDSSVNRSLLKHILAKIGIVDTVLAENGREALEILRTDGAIDCVFTDYWMPEMDGSELARAIRADAKFASLPVYLVTADVEARLQVDNDAFTGIILKPITIRELESRFKPRTSKMSVSC